MGVDALLKNVRSSEIYVGWASFGGEVLLPFYTDPKLWLSNTATAMDSIRRMVTVK